METRKPNEIPADMEEVRQQLESWRSAHAHRSRIPEELWGSAVKIARRHGLYRTSKTLRLDYANLKNRAGIPTSKTDSASAFVELLGGQRLPECVVELENARGKKMRIHLRGMEAPDLGLLSRMFWSSKA